MIDTNALNLSWLVKLRWGAIVGQGALIVVAQRLMGEAFPFGPPLFLVGAAVASNALLLRVLQTPHRIRDWMLACVLALDILLLTALLYLTGGPFNPFSVLYLVSIALSAVVMSARWTWALLALAVGCFGGLFIQPLWFPQEQSHAEHMALMELHMKGMWLAFAIASGLIVYFVQRVTKALAERDLQLAAIRNRTALSEKLASLTTLAAGAAHELGTPLSTIAVVAKEQERHLTSGGDPSEAASDARLIRQQVDRCREILNRMAAHAGENSGEPLVSIFPHELVEKALEGLVDASRVSFTSLGGRLPVSVPVSGVVQALRSVLKNAIESSGPLARVTLTESMSDSGLQWVVSDEGAGMTADILARVTEPFFTTKPVGEGMGLGLFLTRELLERLGGSLDIRSSPGRGTTVELRVPIAPCESSVGSFTVRAA